MPSKAPSKRTTNKRRPSAGGALLIRGPRKALKAIAEFTMRSPAGNVVVTDVALEPTPAPGGPGMRRRTATNYEIVELLPGSDERAHFFFSLKGERVRVGRTIGVKSKPTPSIDESDIIERVTPWAGSEAAARKWYRSQMIPALGDQTAEALVRTGQTDLVRRYLDGIAAGGFA